MRFSIAAPSPQIYQKYENIAVHFVQYYLQWWSKERQDEAWLYRSKLSSKVCQMSDVWLREILGNPWQIFHQTKVLEGVHFTHLDPSVIHGNSGRCNKRRDRRRSDKHKQSQAVVSIVCHLGDCLLLHWPAHFFTATIACNSLSYLVNSCTHKYTSSHLFTAWYGYEWSR